MPRPRHERQAHTARLRQAHIDPDTIGTRLEPLTTREREILELIAGQLTNRDIANRLSIEIGTVKNHVHSMLKKLGVDNRHEAATVCLQEGIVDHVVTR